MKLWPSVRIEKGIGEDGREEDGNTDKGKEGLASWRHKAFPQTI